jgi:electron transport complex protein RnfC
MSVYTFRGGVHPEGNKELSAGKAIQPCLPKGEMIFPLSEHIGKPAAPVVKKNDMVLAGQIIAAADGFISANVISSCSGKVKAIERRLTGAGVEAPCIVIDNDGEYNTVPGVGEQCDYTTLSNAEIIDKVKAAGVVGLGGAAFPTHVKMMPKDPSAIEYIIANGSECEPYITCDDQLMREHSDWIVGGLSIMLQLFPQAKAVICIEDNKPEAIAAMEKAISGDSRMSVMTLQTKFPQGGERNLVYAVTGKYMGSGDLPAVWGCIVDNVATLTAVYRAVCFNEPLMERGFTVTGDAVVNPGNFMVKIGTSMTEVLEAAGGLKPDVDVKKLISGGSMMGMAIPDTEIPIIKGNSALVCLTHDEVEEAEEKMTACIRCGRCIHVCPMGLYPQQMAVAAKRKDYDRYEKIHGLDCIACGSCTFICPAKRPLMQQFKQAKGAILAQKAAARAAAAAKK